MRVIGKLLQFKIALYIIKLIIYDEMIKGIHQRFKPMNFAKNIVEFYCY